MVTPKGKISYQNNSSNNTDNNNHSRIQRQSALSYQPQTVIRNKSVSSGYKIPTSTKSGVLTNAKNNIQNNLRQQNDGGTSTISTGITAGSTAIKSFKAAQNVQPYVSRVTKGTYTVANKTIKVIKSVDSTVGLIKGGAIQINRSTLMQFKSVAAAKVMNTEPMKRLAHAVTKVRTGASTAKKYGIMLANGSVRTVRAVKGITNGTVKINISKQTLSKFKNKTVQGIKFTGKFTGKAVKTGMIKGYNVGSVGVKNGYNGLRTGINGLGDVLSNSNDTGVQAAAMGVKTARYTIRGIKTSPKVLTKSVRGVRTAARVPVRLTRNIIRGSKGVAGMTRLARKMGIKNTVQWYKAQTMKTVAKAGGSAVSASMQLIRALGTKLVVPVIILVLVVVMITNVTSAPVAGVSSIFGGVMSDKDTGQDIDIHELITSRVDTERLAAINEVHNIRDKNLVSNGGNYHYIRLITGYDNTQVELTDAELQNEFFSTVEYTSIIEPIFQTIMLSKYDLEPTQAQKESTFKEIWDTVTSITTEKLPTEHCFGATSPDSRGNYWADTGTCPNYKNGTHSSYTDPRCCYHSHTTNKKGKRVEYSGCNGYYYCQGHRILGIRIKVGGYNELFAKYFTNEITQLEGILHRTPKQEERLKSLKDDYELCQAYIEEIQKNISFGDGSGDGSIDGVKFVGGDGNDTLVNLATLQLGNFGGQPFWSWYGFNSRVEWCACFVSWCSNSTGLISEGIIPKFCSCREGVKWFKSNDEWKGSGYVPVAGNIIFFDWNGDGIANHVGIVVGSDGERVYTIEGNWGDSVRRRSIDLNSSTILGYGIPNY